MLLVHVAHDALLDAAFSFEIAGLVRVHGADVVLLIAFVAMAMRLFCKSEDVMASREKLKREMEKERFRLSEICEGGEPSHFFLARSCRFLSSMKREAATVLGRIIYTWKPSAS